MTPAPNPLQPVIAAYRLGKREQALTLAGEQVALAAPGEFFAHGVMCEVLHRAGRIAELLEFLDLADDFVQDPRGRLMQAKAARRSGDLAQAETLLSGLLVADIAPALHRVAAFELNAVLDRQARHAEAWQVAALPLRVRQSPAWALMNGVAQTRLGHIEAACAALLPLTRGPEPWASEGAAALADVLHLSHQRAALRALLTQAPARAQTPRGRRFEARLLMRADPAQALALLLAIVDVAAGSELQRIAGFDAVKLLDREACYREAHALATRLHAQAPPFELAHFLARMRLQLRLLAKGVAWCPPRADAVDGVAFIVGLPRSGTTLFEQMLDAHPKVAGIGEHDGMSELATSLVGAGVWPYRLNHLPAEAATRMQQHYWQTARWCRWPCRPWASPTSAWSTKIWWPTRPAAWRRCWRGWAWPWTLAC